jgi:predicted dehydrogenase
MLTPEEAKIGRRSFLKALATLPALGAFGWTAYRERLHERPVQAGIIGSGSEGCVLLEQAPEKAIEFKAIADIRPDSRKNALDVIKKKWGVQAEVYPDDYTKLLERRDLEAVVIAVPLWMHAKVAVDALHAGKHVFCEKTMAYSVEQCQQMATAARNGKVFQIGHQRHSNRLYAQALDTIQKGLIGEVYHVRTLWHRNNDWRRDDQIKALQKAAPRFDPSPWGYPNLEELVNWRLYRKYSQGLPAELASHQLDVTNWFSGTVPMRIEGSGGIYKWKEDGRTIEDHVYLICEYPPGPISPGGLTVTFSSITTNAFDNYYEQFMGTKGTIILSGETDAMLFKEGEAAATEIAVTQSAAGEPVMEASRSRLADAAGMAIQAAQVPTSGLDRLEPYRMELEAFCSAIKFGTPVPCTVRDALSAAVVVIKANEAIRNRQTVELPPDLYRI